MAAESSRIMAKYRPVDVSYYGSKISGAVCVAASVTLLLFVLAVVWNKADALLRRLIEQLPA